MNKLHRAEQKVLAIRYREMSDKDFDLQANRMHKLGIRFYNEAELKALAHESMKRVFYSKF